MQRRTQFKTKQKRTKAAPLCYKASVSLAEANTSDLAAGSHLSHLSFCKQSQGACGGLPVAWVTVCCRSSGPSGSLVVPRLSTGWPWTFRVSSSLREGQKAQWSGSDQTLSSPKEIRWPSLLQSAIIHQQGTSSQKTVLIWPPTLYRMSLIHSLVLLG